MVCFVAHRKEPRASLVGSSGEDFLEEVIPEFDDIVTHGDQEPCIMFTSEAII